MPYIHDNTGEPVPEKHSLSHALSLQVSVNIFWLTSAIYYGLHHSILRVTNHTSEGVMQSPPSVRLLVYSLSFGQSDRSTWTFACE